jgi:hypothetical protein
MEVILMTWSKTKQQLENFLCDSLRGCVEYQATSYRYAPDKAGHCCITVNKVQVFAMNDKKTKIAWYQTEQEIKNDPSIKLPITQEDLDQLRYELGPSIPDDRLPIIIKNRKISEHARELIAAQTMLCKSDFYETCNRFLQLPIEKSLQSKDILLNIFAIVDRRVGKKRLLDMRDQIALKHPIVQFFYQLRCTS